MADAAPGRASGARPHTPSSAGPAPEPFRFFALEVTGTRRLSPSLVRVSLTGEDLAHFASLGRDQSLSLFLPHPGQHTPIVPVEAGAGWWAAWRALPGHVRAVMRSYTLSGHRAGARSRHEIDIDFALHGEGGPASRWAAGAAEGHRALVLGPAVADNTAVRFRPPRDTDHVLMWADGTALPAAESVLRSLPAGLRADVWIEVPRGGDRRPLPTAADASVHWLVREESAPAALDALRAAGAPAGQRPYVWLAGEAGTVRDLRRHLVHGRGVDRSRVTFAGYWRRGLTEEQLRERRSRTAP